MYLWIGYILIKFLKLDIYIDDCQYLVLAVKMVPKQEEQTLFKGLYHTSCLDLKPILDRIFSAGLFMSISILLSSFFNIGLRKRLENHEVLYITFPIIGRVYRTIRLISRFIQVPNEPNSNELYYAIFRIGLLSSLTFSAYVCLFAPAATIALLDITPPSPGNERESNILISNEPKQSSHPYVLDYNDTSDFPNSHKNPVPNGTNTIILYGDKKEGSLWSKPLNENVTFIETQLQGNCRK